MPDVTRYYPETCTLDPAYHSDTDSVENLKVSDKVHLMCTQGHSWICTVRQISRYGVTCPYCTGRMSIPGVNDAATLHPFLINQWDTVKNGCDIPNNLVPGTHTSYHWVCDSGHEFTRSLRTHIERRGRCPYCSGFYVTPGVNDVSTVYPRILEYWDDSLNTLDITTLSAQSNKKVVLRCPAHHDHVWEAQVQTFVVKNVVCPYCSNKKVLAGFNDLATTDPDIAAMWGDDNDITPLDVTHGSGKMVQWKCAQGHTWKATVNNVYTNGSRCPICSNHKVLAGYNDFSSAVEQRILDEWDYEKNTVLPEEVMEKSDKVVYWKCSNGHDTYTWRAPVRARVEGVGNCKICNSGISQAEAEIYHYVSSLCAEQVVNSDRNVISPQELDIYIPEKNIAIEFNGLYWHSESCGKDRYYHYNKWKKCKDKGIQLITIWEDEWKDKRGIVQSMLAHKLGLSQGARIYARACTVSPLTSSVAREFLELHHIQGNSSASAHFGLCSDSGELVAVSSWRKNKDILYLDRYATSCTVVGGMGKLLKAGKKFAVQNNLSKVVTFSDNCVSDGGLYEKLGFTCDADIAPDYRYIVGGQRKHKFGYRLKRFRTDKSLLYKEGLTEKQLAKLNGLERIWDCGKVRWVIYLE